MAVQNQRKSLILSGLFVFKSMSDSKTKTGKPDRSRINVNQDYELAYWTKRLGISAAELKRAVKLVGTMVKNVKVCVRVARKKPSK